MILKSFQVFNFRSIRDSEEVKTEDVTCLVGKNEAGKTALLQALYRLNPVVYDEGNFDVSDDFPRKDVTNYEYDVESGKRSVAKVIEATFQLDDADVEEVSRIFGGEALLDRSLKLSKYYDNSQNFTLSFDEAKARKHFIETADVADTVAKQLKGATTWSDIDAILAETESTKEITRLREIIDTFEEYEVDRYIYEEILQARLPEFLYFDEYYQMKGHENVEALIQRNDSGKLKKSDHPLLGLMSLARLDMNSLLEAKRTTQLNNKLEGAGNQLTRSILKYWSQNKHIQMKFDVREARPEDPAGMTKGTNIWGRVHDSVHLATTELGSRSRGFIWFFSFLAWYEDVKRSKKNLILLLDEPGLSLHGRAQSDLLRYIDKELAGDHQVIYTTHSPFMVDINNSSRIRIVQDHSIDATEPLPIEEEGTKVVTNIFDASEDSLFPLQAALGYDIQQSLFIGPNSLIVEGPSDLLYIHEMSALLERDGRTGLSEKWVITPVGGSGKVPTFIALLAPQKGFNVATLIDFQKSDQQEIEGIYKNKLLKKKNVVTYADFVDGREADVEDMFDRDFYLSLVNSEFEDNLKASIKLTDINSKTPRIIRAIEKRLKVAPLDGSVFNHYRPARYLAENMGALVGQISDATKDRFEAAFKRLNDLLKPSV